MFRRTVTKLHHLSEWSSSIVIIISGYAVYFNNNNDNSVASNFEFFGRTQWHNLNWFVHVRIARVCAVCEQ